MPNLIKTRVSPIADLQFLREFSQREFGLAPILDIAMMMPKNNR
jgi:hypothetical protein